MTSPEAEERVATIVTNTQIAPDHDDDFRTWQSRMDEVVKGFDGFLGQEVIPPSPPVQLDWVIIQRFCTPEQLRTWLDSPERSSMLDEAEPLLQGEDEIDVLVGQQGKPSGRDEPVTAVIRTHVAPEAENDFKAWHDRVLASESGYEGFAGCELQPPIEGLQDDWVTLLRFDSQQHLDAWLQSPERQALVHEADRFIDRSNIRRVRTSFEGWFDFGGPEVPPPPAWKMTMIVLLALFPVVMLELMFLDPLLDWLDESPATFIGNALSVSATGFLLVSLASRALRWWLSPAPDASRWVQWKGVLVVLACYAVSVAFFWWFAGAVEIDPITSL